MVEGEPGISEAGIRSAVVNVVAISEVVNAVISEAISPEGANSF